MIGDHCPDDEVLARFVEGRLTAPTRQVVAAHLARCAACLDVAGAVLASASDRSDVLVSAVDPVAPAVTLAGSVSRPPSPSHARHRARRLAAAAGMVIALAGLTGYAGGRWLTRYATSRLTAAASAALGVPVEVGGLSLRLGSHGTLRVRARDVRVGDLGAAAALDVGIPLLAFLRGSPIADAELDRVALAVAMPRAPGAPRSRGGLGGDGRLRLAFDDTPVHVTSLAFDAGSGALTVAADVGAGTVAVSGRLGSAAAPADLRVHAEAIPLAAVLAPGIRLDGTATVEGTIVGPRGAERVEVRVVAAGAVLRGWNPLPSLLDAAAEFPRSPAELPLDAFELELGGSGGEWRMPSLRIRSGTVVITAELDIARDGTIDGSGTADAPPGARVSFTIGGSAAARVVVAR